MSKYLIKGSYNTDGIKGLLKEGGTHRKEAVDKLLADVGGKVEAFYYAFGDHDVYVICDIPDNVSAASIGLRVNAAGFVSVKTTVLLTAKDVDDATKKSVSYSAPGA
jgi:uncharacterized protein with GYD domain